MTRQRTIKDPVTIEGAGLQTGKKARLTLRGSPANSGINFIRLDLPNKTLLNVRSMLLGEAGTGPGRRTTMAVGELEVQTTEHLLAALSGLGIDNIVMELDNVEVPGLDGSAKGFVDAIKKGRVVEQDAPRKILKVAEAVWCEGQNSFIAVFPDEDFKISFTLSYDNPAIGTQFYSVTLNEMEFEANIAPARTFCLEGEARELLRLGFGRGANTGNTLQEHTARMNPETEATM